MSQHINRLLRDDNNNAVFQSYKNVITPKSLEHDDVLNEKKNTDNKTQYLEMPLSFMRNKVGNKKGVWRRFLYAQTWPTLKMWVNETFCKSHTRTLSSLYK